MIRSTFFATLIILLSFVQVKAQQLPQGWEGDTGIETFKVGDAHSGSFAVKVKVNTDVQKECDFQMSTKTPISGSSFKLTFWAKTPEHTRVSGVIDWNSGVSSTYTGTYVEPNCTAWTEFSAEGEVPEGATEASIRLRFYDTGEGFVPGEICFVDNIEFQCPNGSPVTMPNADFENWSDLLDTPSNYPTNFTAVGGASGISLNWTDATGTVLPERYLVVGSDQASATVPVDGTGYDADMDFSDGNVMAIVDFGVQGVSFDGAVAGKTYNFWVYPYNNLGADSKYKTDGTVPTQSVTMQDFQTFYTQGFDGNLGDWTAFSETGAATWIASEFGDRTFAKMTGYNPEGNEANIDWLISPKLDFSSYEKISLSFENAQGYGPEPLQLLVSTDYDGTNPTSATWTAVDANWAPSTDNWQWVNSGSVILDAYNQANVYIAFKYTCTPETAGTWELDNLAIAGIVETSIEEAGENIEFNMYPNPCNGELNVKVADNNSKLEIINLVGNVVKTAQLSSNVNKVQVNSLPAGVYMVRVSNDSNAQSVKKIILK